MQTWSRGDLNSLATFSKFLDSVAVNVSVWYPLNLYTDPGGVNATTAMLAAMPRFDSVFVPGGDGGEVLPAPQFLDVVSQLAALVRSYHPSATAWVSAQQYDQDNVTELMAAMETPQVRRRRAAPR